MPSREEDVRVKVNGFYPRLSLKKAGVFVCKGYGFADYADATDSKGFFY